MKKKIIILGYRSFLSQCLKKKIKSALLIRSKEINTFQKKLNKKFSYIVIINLFYPTFSAVDVNKKNFNYFSQDLIFLFLNKLLKYRISKIIYTSSSIVNHPTLNRSSPRYNYQKKKKIMEKKILDLCKKKKILCVITRPYNIYGEGDKFSIIKKLIKLKNSKLKKLVISNQGNSIRDYINVKDVVKIYEKIASSDFKGIISIGTGEGIKLFEIIKMLKVNDKKILKKKKLNEVNKSICKIFKLKKIIDTNKFIKIKNYLKKINQK